MITLQSRLDADFTAFSNPECILHDGYENETALSVAPIAGSPPTSS